MPRICEFLGIIIEMYYNDHAPPHFHAKFGEYSCCVDINKGIVVKGMLPNKQLKYILSWCELFKEELLRDWELAKNHKPLKAIVPLI